MLVSIFSHLILIFVLVETKPQPPVDRFESSIPIEQRKWYFRHNDNTIRGPYAAARMLQWFNGGYLKADIQLQYNIEDEDRKHLPFIPLVEWFEAGNRAFLSELPPSSLASAAAPRTPTSHSPGLTISDLMMSHAGESRLEPPASQHHQPPLPHEPAPAHYGYPPHPGYPQKWPNQPMSAWPSHPPASYWHQPPPMMHYGQGSPVPPQAQHPMPGYHGQPYNQPPGYYMPSYPMPPHFNAPPPPHQQQQYQIPPEHQLPPEQMHPHQHVSQTEDSISAELDDTHVTEEPIAPSNRMETVRPAEVPIQTQAEIETPAATHVTTAPEPVARPTSQKPKLAPWATNSATASPQVPQSDPIPQPAQTQPVVHVQPSKPVESPSPQPAQHVRAVEPVPVSQQAVSTVSPAVPAASSPVVTSTESKKSWNVANSKAPAKKKTLAEIQREEEELEARERAARAASQPTVNTPGSFAAALASGSSLSSSAWSRPQTASTPFSAILEQEATAAEAEQSEQRFTAASVVRGSTNQPAWSRPAVTSTPVKATSPAPVVSVSTPAKSVSAPSVSQPRPLIPAPTTEDSLWGSAPSVMPTPIKAHSPAKPLLQSDIAPVSFGGSKMSSELESYCRSSMLELLGTDDISLPSFLMTIDSAEEVRSLVASYIVDSKAAERFAEQFLVLRDSDGFQSTGKPSARKQPQQSPASPSASISNSGSFSALASRSSEPKSGQKKRK